MRDLLTELEALKRAGPVGRAVVTSVWGSAPRQAGACMLATPEGRMAGSVSGGCVESAAAGEIAEAIARGTPKVVTFGVSHERAWEVGLACGGTIKVLVEPEVPDLVLAAARAKEGRVVATAVGGALRTGTRVAISEDRVVDGDGALLAQADLLTPIALEALRQETSRTITLTGQAGEAEVFLEVFPPQPTLVIFGGVHIAMALVPMARALGYRTVVADGREAFLTRDRFPEADELLLAWPEEAFRQAGLDAATYVCVLSHDPKFDEPALEMALRSPARYIGAIGSRKTQVERHQRLRAAGFTEEDLARVHGPIGIDLGGRGPAETALGILAQMTLVRFGRSGRL